MKNAIVDGEIVTLDEDGRSNFQKLQNRLGVQNPSQKLMQSVPLDYYAFDLMYADGYDLRKAPLVERKELLQKGFDRQRESALFGTYCGEGRGIVRGSASERPRRNYRQD